MARAKSKTSWVVLGVRRNKLMMVEVNHYRRRCCRRRCVALRCDERRLVGGAFEIDSGDSAAAKEPFSFLVRTRRAAIGTPERKLPKKKKVVIEAQTDK